MTRFLRRLLTDVTGATAVEYGLILALIVLACIAAIMGVATKTIGMWGNVASIVANS